MPATSPRLGIQYPVGTDNVSAYPAAAIAAAAVLDQAVLFTEGTLVSRPAAGTAGRYYLATDDTSSGSAIGTLYFDTGSAWVSGFNPPSRGAVSIATSQSTSSASYTTLATPDQVTGIVLPTNGLIRVWYQATWQGSVTAAPRATIFLNSSQLKVAGQPASAPVTQAAAANGPTNTNFCLSSSPIGLVSVNASQGGPDVTTGQAVCITANGTDVYYDLGGTLTLEAVPMGGPCDIFAAAGTYTVSVQFKAASGSVTASNRKLWVQALSFA